MTDKTQEPVLCINPKVIDPATGKVRNGAGALTYSDTPCAGWSLPLYTSPQPSKPWVPLTEFDIDQIPYSCSHADSRLIAFAIEAKLKDKNAQSSKPLTDDEIDMIYTGVRAVHHDIDSYVFARAIEAAHGIKGDA